MTTFETIHVGAFTYTKKLYYRGDGHDWHREYDGHRNIANAEVSTFLDIIAERDATIKDHEQAMFEALQYLQSDYPKMGVSKVLRAALGEGE